MKKIILYRKSKIDYGFGMNDVAGIRAVARALTFPNPNPMSSEATIQFFDKKHMTFRVGFLPEVMEHAERNGFSLEIQENGHEGGLLTELDGRLYEHQRLAVEAFMKRKIGILQIPTRGGKTFTASEIIRQYLSDGRKNGKVLFLVDNITLFGQAYDDIVGYFSAHGGLTVGTIGAGKNKDWDCRVCVGTVQTLQSALSGKNRELKKRATAYLKELGMLIVDEIHDNCSDARLKLYRRCVNLEYQLSLSATPYRGANEMQNYKLKNWSGGVIYKVEESVLIDSGVLSDYKVLCVSYKHPEVYNSMDYDYETLISDCIHKNDDRDAVVAKFVDFARQHKIKTLLLFSSVEHGERYARKHGVKFISGKTKMVDRKAAVKKFLSGRAGILAASNIFKKGVTLPEAQILINVDGGLEDANTVQRKGRVLGSTKKKTRSLIIDIMDICERYLSVHSEARFNTYADGVKSEDQIAVVDVEDNDWFELAEKWMLDWLLEERGSCSDTL